MPNLEDVKVLDNTTDALIRDTMGTLARCVNEGPYDGPSHVIAQSNLAVARAVQAAGVRIQIAVDDLAAHLGGR